MRTYKARWTKSDTPRLVESSTLSLDSDEMEIMFNFRRLFRTNALNLDSLVPVLNGSVALLVRSHGAS